MAKRATRKGSKVKAKKTRKVKAKRVSKKGARIPRRMASGPPGPGPLYPCRCFNVGGKYEKWVLNAKTGTFDGPTECTRDECRRCNQSKAVVIR